MEIVKDVYVPMRDGVCLALDVYKPDRGGRHPAILSRTPYIKDAALVAGRGCRRAHEGRGPSAAT